MQAAQNFCSVVGNPSGEPCSWIKDVLLSTLALYAAGLALSQLPMAEVSDREDESEGRMSMEQWKELYNRLSAFLGEKKWYATVDFETQWTHQPQESLYGDLADDLADIYRDVMPGLRRWSSAGDEYLGNIVWDWQFHFAAHWGGDHASVALGYLHYLVFSQKIAHEDKRLKT